MVNAPEKREHATRYMMNASTGIMAMVRPEGRAVFHNELGFEVGKPIDVMTQEATVRLLKEAGYEEFTGTI